MPAKQKNAVKKLSIRDAFIIEKYKKDFSPTEIREVLLPREGFAKIGRSTIYDILKANGVKLRSIDAN